MRNLVCSALIIDFVWHQSPKPNFLTLLAENSVRTSRTVQSSYFILNGTTARFISLSWDYRQVDLIILTLLKEHLQDASQTGHVNGIWRTEDVSLLNFKLLRPAVVLEKVSELTACLGASTLSWNSLALKMVKIWSMKYGLSINPEMKEVLIKCVNHFIVQDGGFAGMQCVGV